MSTATELNRKTAAKARRMTKAKRVAAQGSQISDGIDVAADPEGLMTIDKHDEADSLQEWGRAAMYALPLDKLHPHPANRHVDVPSCGDLAERLKAKGQLTPILVRPAECVTSGRVPIGHFQILAGERRYRAAMIAGLDELLARVLIVDDAAALIVLSEENAQREDLDDIERARQIEQLCRGVEEGGAGLTRAAAGKIFALSESGASNLVGLLELPDVWQQRVKRGELPQTFARLLRPYAPHKKLVDAIDKWLAEEVKREGAITWARDDFEHEARSICEPDSYRSHTAKVAHVPDGPLTDEERAKLKIVTLPAIGKYGQPLEICLNEKLATRLADRNRDKAQDSGLKAQGNKKADSRKPKAKATSPPPPTAAELRAKEKEAAARTEKAIEEWRLTLLRNLLAEQFDGELDDPPLRLVLLLISNPWQPRTAAVRKALTTAVRECGGRGAAEGKWEAIASLPMHAPGLCVGKAISHLLRDEQAEMFPRAIEDLALEANVDLAMAWLHMQDPIDLHAEMFARFFELHTRDQLTALGKELGVYADEAKTKAAAVKLFLGKARRRKLPLPKSVKPLKAKRKVSKKAKTPARKK